MAPLLGWVAPLYTDLGKNSMAEPALPTLPALPTIPGADRILPPQFTPPAVAAALQPEDFAAFGAPPQDEQDQEPQPAPAAEAIDQAAPAPSPGLGMAPMAYAPNAQTGAPPPKSAAPPSKTAAPTALSADLRSTITRNAAAAGIDPAYALATADRESGFNPNAGGTGTIRGLFQMSGALRRQYGIAPDADADAQARGFAAFTRDLQGEMAGMLQRPPTPAETYMGHHFGGTRAARMIAGQIAPDTPVTDVFTPRELAGNPHIVKAGTVGELMRVTSDDMQGRLARYADEPPPQPDFSQFGQGDGGNVDMKVNPRPGTEVDLSQYGIPR